MNIEVSSDVAASVWESLCEAVEPLSAADISRSTGVSLNRVSTMLGRFHLAELVERIEGVPAAISPVVSGGRGNKGHQEQPLMVQMAGFKAKRNLDSMAYATAVEVGIPLFLLERTVTLSKQDRRMAFQLAESGEVDAAREAQIAKRRKRVKTALRGRAASRAAATDLAKLIQDVSRVTPVSLPLEKEIQSLLIPSVKAKSELVETPALAKVRKEVAAQAAQALEALIKAMDRQR